MHGVIPFDRFMELALYCPVCGYYEKEADTVGKRGDFYTSVSTGGLFGELLAFQFSEWLDVIQPVDRIFHIAEAGAHRGLLARDILAWLRSHRPGIFAAMEYWLIEPSARRQEWQKETLGEFGSAVRWTTEVSGLGRGIKSGRASRSGTGFRGIIFSNELLDAMPVRRLGWDRKRQEWFEWGVVAEGDKLAWARIQNPEPEVPATGGGSRGRSPTSTQPAGRRPVPEIPRDLLEVLPDGFTTELCPAAVKWWSEAAQGLQRGKLLTIDYGLNADEFFVPERRDGTLRAYFRHHLSNDVLANPGRQDITAHVNFTAIQGAGEALGLQTEQLTTQSRFLTALAGRIMRKEGDPHEWTPSRVRQFQTLTHPEHLGNRFRVLVQSRQ